MTHHAHQEPKMHWKWVILSVIAGLIIIGASYLIVAPMFHSSEIQAVIMLGGCIVTGAIIGYFSPGITINEASIGGALVMIVMLALLAITNAEIQYSKIIDLLLLILGIGFSWVGGWAGEKLQGDESSADEKNIKKFLWKWVLVGVVIGFALNVLLVFLFSTLFPFHLFKFALAGFIGSFVVTGFIVGVKSPGVTLREPAVAGLLIVILDWVFLRFVISLSSQTLTTTYLIVGLVMGFMISLFGAWLGELYQKSKEEKKN
jgi:hypothetical protein